MDRIWVGYGGVYGKIGGHHHITMYEYGSARSKRIRIYLLQDM